MLRFSAAVRGLLILVALSAGVTSEAPAQLAAAHRLPAATAAVASSPYASFGPNDPAPQRMIPRPTPDPTPTLFTAPPVAEPVPPVAPPPARPAAPAPAVNVVVDTTQQALINEDRAANGLQPLTWSSCLAAVAGSNAARMSAQGFISHTNGPAADLSCGLGYSAGENVGYWSAGINDAQLNTMFMGSAGHRANILGAYHYVATAWVVAANGYGYIAVEFA